MLSSFSSYSCGFFCDRHDKTLGRVSSQRNCDGNLPMKKNRLDFDDILLNTFTIILIVLSTIVASCISILFIWLVLECVGVL